MFRATAGPGFRDPGLQGDGGCSGAGELQSAAGDVVVEVEAVRATAWGLENLGLLEAMGRIQPDIFIRLGGSCQVGDVAALNQSKRIQHQLAELVAVGGEVMTAQLTVVEQGLLDLLQQCLVELGGLQSQLRWHAGNLVDPASCRYLWSQSLQFQTCLGKPQARWRIFL